MLAIAVGVICPEGDLDEYAVLTVLQNLISDAQHASKATPVTCSIWLVGSSIKQVAQQQASHCWTITTEHISALKGKTDNILAMSA